MKKMIVTAAAVCILLSACEKADYEKGEKAGHNEHSPAVESEADRAISQNVRHAFKDDAALAPQADGIKITTTNGVVTLRGSVKSESDKSEAGKKARLIQGVKAVDNQLGITR